MSSEYLYRIIKSILLFLRTISIANSPKKEVFFVIGIDTEQDVDKKSVHTGEYRNIKEGIPRLLDIFDDFKAKPSWFITPDVAECYGSFFSELAMKNEVGCHVHPEYFDGSIKDMRMVKILPQFPYQNQLKMIHAASDIIKRNVGIYPRSFRAGRFAVNMDTLRALDSCGFLVDCSMTPFVNWGLHAETLMPFKTFPYFIRVGSDEILEIPPTIICPFGLFPAWLRPSFYSGFDMINITKIRAKSREDPIVLNMMFHSMELIDPNPYFDSEEFFKNMRRIIEYAYEQNVSFITMNNLYHRLRTSISSEN